MRAAGDKGARRLRIAVGVAIVAAVAGGEAGAAPASIDVVVVAPGGSEGAVASEVRARIVHHARASRRYVLVSRAVTDENVLVAAGCNELDLACVKSFREQRGVARVIGAEVKGAEIRLTSVEGAAARGGEWRRLPADASARIDVVDTWIAELFDAYGWVVVRVPGSVAGARVTVGGRPCGAGAGARNENMHHRGTEDTEEDTETKRDGRTGGAVAGACAGAGAAGGGGPRWRFAVADAGLVASDGPGAARRRGGELLPDAVFRCRTRPGRTIVMVSAPGKVAFRAELKVQPWVDNETVAALIDVAGPGAPTIARARVTRTRRSPALLWTSIGLAAAGVGLAAAGVVYGVKASETVDELNRRAPLIEPELGDRLQSELRRRDAYLVAGGVIAAVSAVTWVLYARGRTEVVLVPVAGGVGIAGGF